LRKLAKSMVNKCLAPIGIKIEKADSHDWSDTANFIPFTRTIEAAQNAGLSVADYVDDVMNGVPGSSQHTIDKMSSCGVFSAPMDLIVEIGPGTGRYLEKTIKIAQSSRYEIYETAGAWSDYLVEKYNVILRATDGYSLAGTADKSAAMVHAHKVFDTVPFMVTCCYWHEMARVIRPGGWAVFDVITENCLRGDAMRIWSKSGIRNGSFPAIMPKEVAVNFFTAEGFTLAGSFIVPIPPGTTELLVFKRDG
jgi:hypothetical protein